MTDDEATWLEEQLPLLLAACDEALAAGDAASASFTAAVPGELRPRLERDVAWCQLVRQLWGTDGSTPPLPATDARPPVAAPPTQVGRFIIHQEVGRGSFGVVYRAFDPVLSREVALKVPHPHVLASSELRARFQHEAQAAAGLDHPNLVSVYESGEVDSLCFIASAYCPGPTLAAWLREHKEGMPHRQAAELVATLAEAVEHAHRRGVLHRDLKPANILLAVSDQRSAISPNQHGSSAGLTADRCLLIATPKITDFGLAKLLESDTPGRSQSGDIIGTPSYMAPEQADGVKRTLGPAADVHALGAILYELLTGRPPFQGETLLETLLLVRSADPVPPRRLRPGLPPDLETICLKCLQKEPGKRYRSAQALAGDLQRFLHGQPILARATPLWERAWKWARRRPAAAALLAVSLFAAAVLLGVILAATGTYKQQRDYAEQRRREAVANLRKAREAVDRMLTRVGQETLEEVPQMELVRVQLLADAVGFYEDFARQSGDDPEILFENGRAYGRLGIIEMTLGRLEQAEKDLRQALAILERLGTTNPAHCQEQARALQYLGRIKFDAARLLEANPFLQKAAELQEHLVALYPQEAEYRSDLATTLNTQGALLGRLHHRPPEEEQTYRQVEKLVADLVAAHPTVAKYRENLAVVRCNLANWLNNAGRNQEAEDLFRQDLAFWEEQLRAEPDRVRYRSRLAFELAGLADLLAETQRPREAEETRRRVLGLRKGLADDFPKNPYYQHRLAEAQRELADLLAKQGSPEEARRLVEQALGHARTARTLGPGVESYQNELATVARVRADVLLSCGDHAEAARAALELPSLFHNAGEGYRSAGSLLARCAALAGEDGNLPPGERQSKAEGYAGQALPLLCEALQRGGVDRKTLGSGPVFAVLRQRDDFQELLREPPAR
jgi:tetratricopeptide (TPR) repeat protein